MPDIRQAALLLTTVSLLWGCTQGSAQVDHETVQPEQAVARKGDALFFQYHTGLWQGPIPVCFVDSTLSSDWSFIRTKLEATWGSAADLTFTGFQLCPGAAGGSGGGGPLGGGGPMGGGTAGGGAISGGAAGGGATEAFVRVRLVQGQGGSGQTLLPLGTGTLRRTNVWSVSIDKPANNQSYYEYMIVHEFGHVLGFPHEYDRSDESLANCTGYAAGEFATAFDEDSIMTALYCGRPQRTDLSARDREGVTNVYGAPRLFKDNFSVFPNGWSEENPRFLADVNADGLDDLIGFGSANVWVALNLGGTFGGPTSWLSTGFTSAQGWSANKHPRTMADVNNDQRADIIGFSDDTVLVSLAQAGGGFSAPQVWVSNYSWNLEWETIKNPRFVADVNGDGRADIVGFGTFGVLVSLSTGSSFQSPVTWSSELVGDPPNGQTLFGWNSVHTPRQVGDVNGDGRADIVGFSPNGDVRVGLSNGTAFQATTTWLTGAYGFSQNWNGELHPRLLADMNGDGRKDIVGFGSRVWVSYSTGTSFSAPVELLNQFVATKGWTTTLHPRTLARVNAGSALDIVGFGNRGMHVFLR